MYARDVERAQASLKQLRSTEWEDLALAALAFAGSLVATQVFPQFALPLFVGAVVVGALGVRAVIREWDLVDSLVEDPEAYVIPRILESASRETTRGRREEMAARIRGAVPELGSPTDIRLRAVATELMSLARELEDDELELDPAAAVACSRLMYERDGPGPLFDGMTSAEELRARIQHVRAGFAPAGSRHSDRLRVGGRSSGTSRRTRPRRRRRRLPGATTHAPPSSSSFSETETPGRAGSVLPPMPAEPARARMETKGVKAMTTLVKWAPFEDLDLIERRMRRMLEDFGVAPAPLPAVDLYETEKEFIVELDVPGFEEKELGLEATDHTLVIRGERVKEKEANDKTFYLHERLEREFERRFKLPIEADIEHVDAKYRTGVLEVHVPKIEQAKARKIEITA